MKRSAGLCGGGGRVISVGTRRNGHGSRSSSASDPPLMGVEDVSIGDIGGSVGAVSTGVSRSAELKQAPTTVRHQLSAALVEQPPEIVVMDGYTKLTYGRNVPLLDSLVRRDYTLIASSNQGVRPVSVFRRNTSPEQGAKGK